MKIICDNIIFSLQKHGGISVVWSELIKHMIEDSEIDLSLLGFRNQNYLLDFVDTYGVDYVQNNLQALPLVLQRYLNPKFECENEYIFHSTYYRTASGTNVHNITTVHDFIYEFHMNGLPRLLHGFQKSRALNNSEHIVCISENTKHDLLKLYPKTDEQKVSVVYNGVSDDYYRIQTKELLFIDDFPFGSKEFVLYVGDRRAPYKNFKMAVQAAKKANFPIVIVGHNFSEDEKLFIDSLFDSTQYYLFTNASNSLLNKLYNLAAFLIYPSIYEGFGIPVVEAQKAGCAVICSNTSSIPEISGGASFLLDNINSDDIAQIIVENKSRNGEQVAMIENGVINSVRFSWERSYAELKRIYNNLLI